MKILNYSITFNDKDRNNIYSKHEETYFTKLQALKRYIELLTDVKYSHLSSSEHDISNLKFWKITTKEAIEITGIVNKFIA